MTDVIRVGTRGSWLARTQAGHVAAALASVTGRHAELVIIRSEGDDLRVPLDSPSRPGVFVATLRDSLLAGDVDVVVHSFKDLPSQPVPGLTVAAIPQREDPRDGLVSRFPDGLGGLPPGARVATSSPRRVAALHRACPQAEVVPIRGNIDTRLSAVAEGRADAVVLAMAGLHRVGRAEGAVALPESVIVPAPAQGALAVECRSDNPLVGSLTTLDHPISRLCVTAERAVLRGVEAACTTAVGANAWLSPQGTLGLLAELSNHRGVEYSRVRFESSELPADQDARTAVAEELGMRVAAALLETGTDSDLR